MGYKITYPFSEEECELQFASQHRKLKFALRNGEVYFVHVPYQGTTVGYATLHLPYKKDYNQIINHVKEENEWKDVSLSRIWA
jgi:hypothetical protein